MYAERLNRIAWILFPVLAIAGIEILQPGGLVQAPDFSHPDVEIILQEANETLMRESIRDYYDGLLEEFGEDEGAIRYYRTIGMFSVMYSHNEPCLRNVTFWGIDANSGIFVFDYGANPEEYRMIISSSGEKFYNKGYTKTFREWCSSKGTPLRWEKN